MKKHPVITIALIGLALLIAAAAVLTHRHDRMFGVDGETYYIAARTLLAGGNPYSNVDMVRVGLLVDGPSVIAKGGVQQMTNLPASILPFLPLSLLSASVYDWTLIALAAFCIPLAIFLSARLLRLELTPAALTALSILAAAFPPVWRSLVVGQPLAPILACLLAICCLAGAHDSSRQAGRTAGWTLLSLVKATCSLPLAGWLLLTGGKKLRFAIVGALAAFALLNAVIVAHLGPHTFMRSYQAANAYFMAGGANDPYTGGRGGRIDLQPLAALIAAPAHLAAVTAALDLIAALPLLALLVLRPGLRFGDSLIAVLLFTLLVTYHRSYDAVLALPMLPLVVRNWRAGDYPAAIARAAALILAAATLGDHSLQSVLLRHYPLHDSIWVRPAAAIALYLSVAVPALRAPRLAAATPPALPTGPHPSALPTQPRLS